MKTIGVLFIFVAIVLLGGAFVLGVTGVNLTPDDGTPKHKMYCTVTLKNPIGDVRVQSYTCENVGECGFWGFNIYPLGLFSDKGYVILESGGAIDKKSFDIAELGTQELFGWGQDEQTFTLQVCTASNQGLITVKDDSNNVVDTKQVSI